MTQYADKANESEKRSFVQQEQRKSSQGTFQFVDNRPEAVAQRKLIEMVNNSSQVKKAAQLKAMIDNSPQVKQAAQLKAMINNSTVNKNYAGVLDLVQKKGPLDEDELQFKKDKPVQRKGPLDEEELQFKTEEPIQKQENKTDLPDNLKAGVENLSGMAMDDVRVHYNSSKPAQLNAYAYTQGTEIHVAPGQEKHLPHEAWHVVQQKQGRVQPTMQMKGGVAVNDDKGLEREADGKGDILPYEKVQKTEKKEGTVQGKLGEGTIQRVRVAANIQPNKKELYRFQSSLVRVTTIKYNSKSKSFDVDYTTVWPQENQIGKTKNTELYHGEDDERYLQLKSAMQKSETQKKQEKIEHQQAEKIKLEDPVVQWQVQAAKTLNQVALEIGNFIAGNHASSSMAKEGANVLDEIETACVRHYSQYVCLEDPYIAVKKIQTGYAVASNKGGIQCYDDKGNQSGNSVNLPKTGRAQHCEAILNEQYAPGSLPAKATKAEGGYTVAGAASQNCLLCSLDAIRRGYPYDPHTNPPNKWNYQVTAYSSPLFPDELKANILDKLKKLYKTGEQLGIQFDIPNDDQDIVDTLCKINMLMETKNLKAK